MGNQYLNVLLGDLFFFFSGESAFFISKTESLEYEVGDCSKPGLFKWKGIT